MKAKSNQIKQDAVGAYILAWSMKILRGGKGGCNFVCVLGGFEKSVRAASRALPLPACLAYIFLSKKLEDGG